jgi:hypothetical protein
LRDHQMNIMFVATRHAFFAESKREAMVRIQG